MGCGFIWFELLWVVVCCGLWLWYGRYVEVVVDTVRYGCVACRGRGMYRR